jgi:nucleoid-associated protein YgaU
MRVNVTRELKLALIVGFSLVLVVTILVSDYFSKARRVSLATPAGDTQVALRAAPDWKPAPPEQLAPSNPALGGLDAAVPPPVGGSDMGEGSSLASGPAPIVIRQGSGWKDSSIDSGTLGAVVSKVPDQPLVRTRVEPELNGGVMPVKPALGSGAVVPPDSGISTPVTKVITTAGEKSHTVSAGDTLYVISKKYYGTTKYWKELAAFNSATLKSPEALKLGQKLRIPTVDLLGGTKPSDVGGVVKLDTKSDGKQDAKGNKSAPAPAGKTYTVQKGDTPGVIAQKTLGTSRKATELMKFNKIDDETGLRIGMVLNIPN